MGNCKSININNILVCMLIYLICKPTTKTEKHHLLIGSWIQMVETHPSDLHVLHKMLRKHLKDCLHV